MWNSTTAHIFPQILPTRDPLQRLDCLQQLGTAQWLNYFSSSIIFWFSMCLRWNWLRLFFKPHVNKTPWLTDWYIIPFSAGCRKVNKLGQVKTKLTHVDATLWEDSFGVLHHQLNLAASNIWPCHRPLKPAPQQVSQLSYFVNSN